MISFDPRSVDSWVKTASRKWGLTLASTATIAAIVTASLGGWAESALARDSWSGPSAAVSATVRLDALPDEARRTEQLIRAGGPFPYAKDGVVFGNRERILPRQPRGWYREYTVRTPGSRDRGARRIVCGGDRPTEPEACFYTEDHYASFKRIVK